MVKEVQTIQKKIICTASENESIKKRMGELGINKFSTYARSVLLGGVLYRAKFTELGPLNKKIKRIGDEINQIAKEANSISGPLPDSQIEKLLEQYDELEKSICEFFEMDPNAVRNSTPD